ncbi:hypothetical protein BDB00DRAFT_852271, partial [Zychaea mexicana]|uniref:uncharacterized protein n=1 Tax=Zychaea mexicana TaxID=64656 RepID=UPI0022FEE74A
SSMLRVHTDFSFKHFESYFYFLLHGCVALVCGYILYVSKSHNMPFMRNEINFHFSLC